MSDLIPEVFIPDDTDFPSAILYRRGDESIWYSHPGVLKAAEQEIERLTSLLAELAELRSATGDYIRSLKDKLGASEQRVEALEAVKEAAQEALECLYFHSFEPGEDPRISNLAGALLVADGTLAATEQEDSDG